MNLAQFYDPNDYYQYLMEQDPTKKAALKQAMDMKASQAMQQAWQQKLAGARAGGPEAKITPGAAGTKVDPFPFLSTHLPSGGVVAGRVESGYTGLEGSSGGGSGSPGLGSGYWAKNQPSWRGTGYHG